MITARRNGFIGPLLLIGLGVVFLLNNLGFLDWEIWSSLARLWPIILIALGLEILIGRGVSWGSFALALAALAVIGMVSFLSGFRLHYPGWEWPVRSPNARGWSAPLTVAEKTEGATSAELEIEATLAGLRLAAAEDPLYLIHGTIADGGSVSRKFERSGSRALIELSGSGHPVFPFRDRSWPARWWDLRLNPDIPWTMRIETGVGSSDLDLSHLRVAELRVKTGIGRTRLVLPASGRVKVEINGGIGETIILIPRGLEAKIRVTQGIGQVNVAGDFRREGEYYITPGFTAGENAVQLEIEGGIGRISIGAAD